MNLTKIFDLFPPPRFLDLPYAGLSISDRAIRCIQFGKKDGKLSIEKYAEIELPSGAITSGDVNDKEKVITAWKKLKSDLHLGYVKVSLPEEKGYLFTAKIPIVKPEEVKNVIESKI